ncbi:MAG: HEAT repeat domain-containing protein [Planctomycetes bacterium]|nr:HEAT repeat domain-containing protein [Planctomycetota bacterium]
MSKKQNVTLTLGILLIVSAFYGTVCLGQDQQQNIPNQIQRLWDRMNQYAQTGLWEQASNSGAELMDLNPDAGVVTQLGQSETYTNTYRQLTMTNADALIYRDNAIERIITLVKTRWYWDDFIHYALLGRFDLTEQFGQALLDLPPSSELLLELAESDEYKHTYRSLSLMQENESLQAIAAQILMLIEEGRSFKRADVNRIALEVKRLSSATLRGRMLAINRLKDSGEWAVPVMIEALRDPSRQEEYAVIRQALPELGKSAVNPLLVVLQECDNLNVLLVVAEVLGKIGYRSGIPYMLEVYESDQSAELKAAALKSLDLIDRSNSSAQMSAAQAFVQLSADFYDHLPTLAVPANQEFANIWFWDNSRGLYREAVRRDAFDELMAMRCCESALLLDRNLGSASSLWVSAFFRLEAEEHQYPNYFVENHADAGTIALTAGPEILHQVLVRALNDNNRPVALMAITALRLNSGQKSLLFNFGSQQPLIDALSYPDREVRFSAALAIAGSLPSASFGRSELVLPILVEALQQKGKLFALVVDGNQERRTGLVGQIQNTGVFSEIVSGESFGVAMEDARRLPSFDLIVLAADIAQPGIAETMSMIQQDSRMAFSPVMVIVNSSNLTTAKQMQEQYRFMGVAFEQQTADYLITEADEILSRNQTRKFSAELADVYATNAAIVMQNLAVTNNKVLNLKEAESALIEAAMTEERIDIQVAATSTLARLDSTAAQRAIARLTLDDQRAMPIRHVAMQNLSISAKAFGSLLSMDDIAALYEIVSSTTVDNTLRNLASQSYGSLNLPSAIISQLIIDQISKGAVSNGNGNGIIKK